MSSDEYRAWLTTVPFAPTRKVASILGVQLRLKRRQHLVEEGGGFRSGGHRGIAIDEGGERTLRWDVVIGKNGLDAAGRAQAGVGILNVNLLGQNHSIAKPGQEILVRIGSDDGFAQRFPVGRHFVEDGFEPFEWFTGQDAFEILLPRFDVRGV